MSPGGIHECRHCGLMTIEKEKCPRCGRSALEPVTQGP